MSFRIQRVIHWLEMGQGRRVLLTLALVSFVVLFSWIHTYKRFAGPTSEFTIEQAVLARHIAEGKGFTTSVQYPQTLAFLERRNDYKFSPDVPMPELYHAPLYPLVLAGGLAITPEPLIDWIWADPESDETNRYPAFNADYYLLAVNLVFFWGSCVLTFLLGRALFSPALGVVALLGVILSVALWDVVLSVTGVSLLLFLYLVLFLLWTYLEKLSEKEGEDGFRKGEALLAAGIGLTFGLIFLTEYTALLTLVVFIGYAVFRFRKIRLVGVLAPALVALLACIGPWCWRNVVLTGSPTGLALQNIALKTDDPTAEPLTIRRSMKADWPDVGIRKIGNKGLKGIEENLKSGVWSGGAYVFTAFFLVGCIYRHRNPASNCMRWNAVLVFFLMVLGHPFFTSGESERLPVYYLAPLLIVFGGGFFLIMLDSTGRRGGLPRNLFIAALLAFQGFPMAHNLLEPKRLAFTYPPYVPALMTRLRTDITENFNPGYGAMADIPAGASWYAQQPVWGQPTEYSDFVDVLIRQDIGALLLSPKVLDKPYFSSLLRADLDIGEDFKKKRYWGSVYGGLQQRDIPDFFPLQQPIQISSNIYVLVNRFAWKPRSQLSY